MVILKLQLEGLDEPLLVQNLLVVVPFALGQAALNDSAFALDGFLTQSKTGCEKVRLERLQLLVELSPLNPQIDNTLDDVIGSDYLGGLV